MRSTLCLLIFCATLSAQERWQARSMVMSQHGIVATSQTLASQVGAQILAKGGSAVDAAIAANLVLGVVEPMMNGIGGDLFMIHWNAKTGQLTGLNASGWSGKGYTLEALAQRGHHTGIHTVTVPGAVEGFAQAHKRFGKLPWKDLFLPAIHYASAGFPVTEIIQWDWEHSVGKLEADQNAKRVYLPGGRAPQIGDMFQNPELAKALTLIANNGPAAFYRGPITDAILQTSARLNGTLTREDFALYQPEWVTPISTVYRGWKVSELPPNGQGVGALMMLNLFSAFPISQWDPLSAEALHTKIEAQKLAYADLAKYIADPRFGPVPVAGLLDAGYAKRRAAGIDAERANCSVQPGEAPGSKHTIYLSVVDKEGNIVSWIQSLSDLWGSGVVVDGMGFHLHDRANGFVFEPGHPNSAGPRKRPFHTIIPGFMEKGDQHIGFGIMRGSNQPQAHAQFISYIADHGMNIQAALEAPRFTKRDQKGCSALIESRVPEKAREALTQKGHYLDVRAEYSGLMGGGQAVMYNSTTKVKSAASSPRKDGAAIPEPPSFWTK
ncbi:MAG: gamma-glutamyltransferase [Bryobacteraceae bacterium]|nr:gamma-glutamyltransferase [Bryobacteraceae bacterium]